MGVSCSRAAEGMGAWGPTSGGARSSMPRCRQVGPYVERQETIKQPCSFVLLFSLCCLARSIGKGEMATMKVFLLVLVATFAASVTAQSCVTADVEQPLPFAGRVRNAYLLNRFS